MSKARKYESMSRLYTVNMFIYQTVCSCMSKQFAADYISSKWKIYTLLIIIIIIIVVLILLLSLLQWCSFCPFISSVIIIIINNGEKVKMENEVIMIKKDIEWKLLS